MSTTMDLQTVVRALRGVLADVEEAISTIETAEDLIGEQSESIDSLRAEVGDLGDEVASLQSIVDSVDLEDH